jgi:hypothetical protein
MDDPTRACEINSDVASGVRLLLLCPDRNLCMWYLNMGRGGGGTTSRTSDRACLLSDFHHI